ncbi:amidase domain-containing protein [Bacillaceae bacterium W0354]
MKIEGEVLQVDFTNNGSKDHTMIVTKKTSSEIYLTYHTNDTKNRSFKSLSISPPKAKWIPHLIKGTF